MSAKPAVKTTFAAGILIAPVVVWLLNRFVGDVPIEAAAAIGGLIAGIGGPLYRRLQIWADG